MPWALLPANLNHALHNGFKSFLIYIEFIWWFHEFSVITIFFQIAQFVYLFLCTFNIGTYITTFIFVNRIRRFVVTEYLMHRIEQGQASGSFLKLVLGIVIFVSLHFPINTICTFLWNILINALWKQFY